MLRVWDIKSGMIKELLAENRNDILCVESQVVDEPITDKGLFFYHIPKTGGLTFYYALRFAFEMKNHLKGGGLLTSRIERDLPDRRLYLHEKEPFQPPMNLRESPWGFIATHEPFGLHDLFSRNFFLTTIVRDPVSRVASEYTYSCMRADTMPNESDFEKYFRAEENREVGVRQLSGRMGVIVEDALETAISNLEDHFHSFISIDRIQGLLEVYLSLFGLPNVIMENANRTLPRFQMDSSKFSDEIETLNTLDAALFKYVLGNGRMPDIGSVKEGISPDCVIIQETEKRDASSIRYRHCLTSDIIE